MRLGSDSRLRICHYTRASGSVRSICSTWPKNKHMMMLLPQNPFLGNRWSGIEKCDYRFHCINLGLSFRKFTRQGGLKTPRAMFPWQPETDKGFFLCHGNFIYSITLQKSAQNIWLHIGSLFFFLNNDRRLSLHANTNGKNKYLFTSQAISFSRLRSSHVFMCS